MNKKDLEFAKNLAKEASKITKQYFGLDIKSEWKSDNTPLTEADTKINKMVIEAVKAKYPDHGILGEEESYNLEANKLWVCDPIDGTQPFSNGIPLSTFCLALVEDGEVKVAVAADFFTDRIYWAVKGQGAFVNGERLSVNNRDSFQSTYFAQSSMMPERYKSTGEILDLISNKKCKIMNFRSFTYCCLSVASGHFVGAIIGVGNPWDAVCPKLIVEEAGGKVTDLDGNDRRYDKPGNGLLVSNGILHDQLLELIK